MTHGTPAAEPHHPQEPEYVNDTNSTAYNGNRHSYAYAPHPVNNSLAGEHPHLSPDMTHSASSQSNGALERVPNRGHAQWAPPAHYSSGQRPAVYSALSDTRSPATNGAAVSDHYATPPSNGTPAGVYPPMKASNKRAREDDDREQQVSPRTQTQNGETNYDYKRRKTISDPSVNGVVGASVGLQGVTTGAVPRRR